MTVACVVLSQVRLLLLAALSNEHLLLIGKPGTAKSQLGRRLRCGFWNPLCRMLCTHERLRL